MAEVQTPPGASVKDTALIALSVLVLLVGIARILLVRRPAAADTDCDGGRRLGSRRSPRMVQLVRPRILAICPGFARRAAQSRMASRMRRVKTTYVVFIFAIVMGLFFWVLDWVLTWMTRFLGGTSG